MGSRPEIGAAVADSDVGSALLEVRGATAGYGTLTVLRNISLTVVPKSVVAILGPNGAGKTTLMRLMTGIIKPTIGQVFLGGEDVSFSPPHVRSRQGFCHIPEGRGIFPSLTVRENLLMAYPKSKGDEVDPISQSIEVLPELGIRLRQIAGSLSGGEQQMLALARAIVSNAKVVAVDEASLGLAPRVVERVYSVLEHIVESGTSVVLVEQYVNRAIEFADYAYMLNRGEVVFSGSTDELERQDVVSQYLGSSVL